MKQIPKKAILFCCLSLCLVACSEDSKSENSSTFSSSSSQYSTRESYTEDFIQFCDGLIQVQEELAVAITSFEKDPTNPDYAEDFQEILILFATQVRKADLLVAPDDSQTLLTLQDDLEKYCQLFADGIEELVEILEDGVTNSNMDTLNTQLSAYESLFSDFFDTMTQVATACSVNITSTGAELIEESPEEKDFTSARELYKSMVITMAVTSDVSTDIYVTWSSHKVEVFGDSETFSKEILYLIGGKMEMMSDFALENPLTLRISKTSAGYLDVYVDSSCDPQWAEGIGISHGA